MFVIKVIFSVIVVYGILSLVQDLINEFTYKRISHDMKVVIFANNLEEKIEQFIVEFYQMKKVNAYKKIVVVDLEEDDEIEKIKTRLYNSEINVDILSKEQGKEYLEEII